jgi:hypothetical protein
MNYWCFKINFAFVNNLKPFPFNGKIWKVIKSEDRVGGYLFANSTCK